VLRNLEIGVLKWAWPVQHNEPVLINLVIEHWVIMALTGMITEAVEGVGINLTEARTTTCLRTILRTTIMKGIIGPLILIGIDLMILITGLHIPEEVRKSKFLSLIAL